MGNTCVAYHIVPRPAHVLQIRAVCFPNSGVLSFYLPIWIPGSYTRRDFSRHVSKLRVTLNGQPIAVSPIGLSQWCVIIDQSGECVVEYDVYAHDYSVRGCYLDDERAIINPCCVCVAFTGLESAVHRLVWQPDADRKNWVVAGAPPIAENTWQASSYQTLIDTPLMFAQEMRCKTFSVGAVEHTIVLTGVGSYAFNFSRLCTDVAKICAEAARLFGGFPLISTYYFLCFLTESTYGGLEHTASSMLMAPRNMLPSNNGMRARYKQLLSLFSHEYFHLWNVKDMRASIYRHGYDLCSEQPDEMLWVFEGFTAYFDSLLLVRSGVISEEEYLLTLAQCISNYLQRRGGKIQTLAQSSYEAWTKLYGQDENASNISTNYYVHGALSAWCMDVFLRVWSNDTLWLGKLLAILWQDGDVKREGLTETLFLEKAKQYLPFDKQTEWNALLQRLIHSVEPLPLDECAKHLGIELALLPPVGLDAISKDYSLEKQARSYPGFDVKNRDGHWYVWQLDPEGSAARAGIAMGDELLSINQQRVTQETLWQCLWQGKNGTDVRVEILRDGLVHYYCWSLMKVQKTLAKLKLSKAADSVANARYRRWVNRFFESD